MKRRIPSLLAMVGMLLATGCEQPLVDEDETTPTDRPAVEATGPEPPAPKARTKPAFEMADVPDGLDRGGNIERQRCLEIKWLGPDIPDGVTVKVTDVQFDPEQFTKDPFDGCRTELCDIGYVFDAGNFTEGRCFVPATATEPNAGASLQLSGKAQCPAGERRLCRFFEESIEKRKAVDGWIRVWVEGPGPEFFPESDDSGGPDDSGESEPQTGTGG